MAELTLRIFFAELEFIGLTTNQKEYIMININVSSESVVRISVLKSKERSETMEEKTLIEECTMIARCDYSSTSILKGIHTGTYYALPNSSFDDSYINTTGTLYWYKRNYYDRIQEGLLYEWKV